MSEAGASCGSPVASIAGSSVASNGVDKARGHTTSGCSRNFSDDVVTVVGEKQIASRVNEDAFGAIQFRCNGGDSGNGRSILPLDAGDRVNRACGHTGTRSWASDLADNVICRGAGIS